MIFEPTITLGALITAGLSLFSTIALVIGFIWALKTSVTTLDLRLGNTDKVVAELQDEIKKLTVVVVDISSIRARLDGFERRIVLQGERVDRIETRLNSYLDAR